MTYEHDLSDEKEPQFKKLLPEGWRIFTVLNCEEATSKSGNEMFIFHIEDDETKYVDKIYPIAVKGKRWFLKNILTACGVEAGQDGVYKWDIPDVINKKIHGLVEHEPNEYINREGVTVKTTQHRIVKFETLAWDE